MRVIRTFNPDLHKNKKGKHNYISIIIYYLLFIIYYIKNITNSYVLEEGKCLFSLYIIIK